MAERERLLRAEVQAAVTAQLQALALALAVATERAAAAVAALDLERERGRGTAAALDLERERGRGAHTALIPGPLPNPARTAAHSSGAANAATKLAPAPHAALSHVQRGQRGFVPPEPAPRRRVD